MPYKDEVKKKEYAQEYSKSHRETMNKNNREYKKRNKNVLKDRRHHWVINNYEKNLLGSARRNSKLKNIDFSIELSDIVVPEFCPIFGCKLQRTRNRADDQASLDRIDSSKGYIKGNVWVISWRANRLKNNLSIDDLEKILVAMKVKLDSLSFPAYAESPYVSQKPSP